MEPTTADTATNETETVETIEFFFDPLCPWTWLTSRWLVDVADGRALDIEWRNLSLPVLNAGKEIPEHFVGRMAISTRMHRVIAALRADGRLDLVGDVYTEFGRRVHHDGAEPTVELARSVVEAAGAGDWVAALDDEAWDEGVAASTHEAIALAGPDVGSPILVFGDPRVGFFGPIVSPPPTGDDAQALFDTVLALAAIPGVYEIKRGRTSPPEMGTRP